MQELSLGTVHSHNSLFHGFTCFSYKYSLKNEEIVYIYSFVCLIFLSKLCWGHISAVTPCITSKFSVKTNIDNLLTVLWKRWDVRWAECCFYGNFIMLLSEDRHDGCKDCFFISQYNKDGQFLSPNKSSNNTFLKILL